MDFGEHRRLAPLQRAKDVDFETEWQRAVIERGGHLIVHVANTKRNERILVHRTFFGEGMDDEDLIILGARIFSENGVKVNDPQMLLMYDPDEAHMMISDLRVDKEDAGRGYGSALMTGMFQLITSYVNPLKYVSGWISGVDWDHVERSEGFYSKHGFRCDLDHERRSGNILWVNPKASGSVEEFISKALTNGFPATD